MLGFLRRKKKHEDEEEEEEEEFESKPLKRKKNPTPPRQRRAKEEKKPWGKRERYWVAGVFGVTILASGILAMYARQWKLPGLPRIKPPEVNVFTPEKIVFTNEPDVDEQTQESIDKIRNDFSKATSNLSGVYGFYVVDLEGGYSYGINQNEIFQAASLIKLPIMAGMFLQSENGELDLDKQHILKDSEKVGGSGSLYYEPEGTAISYLGLLEMMGQVSDNTAFKISVDKLGEENIAGLITNLGMIDTSYETNKTTPFDIGQFFKKLWEGRLLTKQHTDLFLEYLTDTAYEDHLAAGIPEDIRVAHKYGREVHVVNDGGIVYADNPFVLVIMSKGVVESEADEAFPELAKLLFIGQQNLQ